MTEASLLAPVYALLDAQAAFRFKLEASQTRFRELVAQLPSVPESLMSVRGPPLPSPPTRKRSIESLPSDYNDEPIRSDLSEIKRIRVARYQNYSPEEETIRNDYSQQYVDSGEWPQNFVMGAKPDHRFEEYPKQQRLLNLKKQAVASTALPPCYLPLSEISSMHPNKFDVILIDPPFSSKFTWDTLAEYPVPALASDPSFVFLWVGSGAGDGLEKGREILSRWGYRRCEDVVWLKTNTKSNAGPGGDPPTTSLLTRTKQHCLIGIRGTVRRSTDSWFVHCNVDTDVMIWEGDPSDPTRKPPEMYSLIQNFCLGIRRLELFGRKHGLRPGWVTVGENMWELDEKNDTDALRWDKTWWEPQISSIHDVNGRHVVPTTADIELLRPKSPNRGTSTNVRPGSNSGNNRPTFGGMAHGPQGMGSVPAHSGNFPQMVQQQNNQFSQYGISSQHQQPYQQQQFSQQPFLNQPHPQRHQVLGGQQQSLNAYAQPFVPSMGIDPMAVAAMVGFGHPAMMGSGGYGGQIRQQQMAVPDAFNNMIQGMDPVAQMQMQMHLAQQMNMGMGMGMHGVPIQMPMQIQMGMPTNDPSMQMQQHQYQQQYMGYGAPPDLDGRGSGGENGSGGTAQGHVQSQVLSTRSEASGPPRVNILGRPHRLEATLTATPMRQVPPRQQLPPNSGAG